MLCGHLRETPVGLTKIHTLLVKLTKMALAWELQRTPSTDHNKGPITCAPGPVTLSVPYLDLPMWPLEVCWALPLGCMSNKLLYFSFSCGLVWNFDSALGTLCST